MAKISIWSGTLASGDVNHIKDLHGLIGQESRGSISIKLISRKKSRNLTRVEIAFTAEELTSDIEFFCEQIKLYLEAISSRDKVEIRIIK